jgi:hypothetical protein
MDKSDGRSGHPVWIVLEHPPEWKRMLDRSDSPWRPTIKLYRQSAGDLWDDLLDRVARDVAKSAAAA